MQTVLVTVLFTYIKNAEKSWQFQLTPFHSLLTPDKTELHYGPSPTRFVPNPHMGDLLVADPVAPYKGTSNNITQVTFLKCMR
jgi:hypothetical protein